MGRRAEREAVERLLTDARAGRSGALVVFGEAGIGKTALLEHAHERAAKLGLWRGDDAGAVFIEATLARAAVEHLDADAVSKARYALAVRHSARGNYGPP